MTFSFILSFLGPWSLIGAVAFSLVVVFLFRSGAVYTSRTEEGHLKKEMPLKGILTMLAFLCVIIGFMTTANYFGLVSRQIELEFWPVFWLDLALIMILIVYDTLVIDWWVIGIWRPVFLQLPETMNKTEMKEHIRRSFFVAPIFGVLLALVSAAISAALW
jgi:hypothetical protein